MFNIHADSTQEAIGMYQDLKKIEIEENQPEKKANQKMLEVPTCPKCGAPMVLRLNGKKGNQFWGCQNFPQCKGVRQPQAKKEIPAEEELPVINL